MNYSTTEPQAGQTLTVTVTPRSNTYGGTISYLYQYSSDGATWTDSGAATTATTKNITIPEGAGNFRVRVRASDNYGFTSGTYIYGDTLIVDDMQAFIGVGGVAREATKMYVGVNGIAREVVEGYVGVNDIARRWF